MSFVSLNEESQSPRRMLQLVDLDVLRHSLFRRSTITVCQQMHGRERLPNKSGVVFLV
jgi:hypothetical protein